MPLDHKPFDQLDSDDLADLVENSVAEGTTLDYKAQLPTNQDEDKREFLRDVSSFANTSGGHIVYGISEEGGVPTGLPGFGLVVRVQAVWLIPLEPTISGCTTQHDVASCSNS